MLGALVYRVLVRNARPVRSQALQYVDHQLARLGMVEPIKEHRRRYLGPGRRDCLHQFIFATR